MAKKILVVIDDADVQTIVARAMAALHEEEPVEVVCAQDGRAALSLLPEMIPHLLVAEISLSGKNGYVLCRYAREEPELAGMGVLLLDDQFDPLREQLSHDLGADAYLSMPFQAAELAEVVRRLFAGQKTIAGGTTPEIDGPDASQRPKSHGGAESRAVAETVPLPSVGHLPGEPPQKERPSGRLPSGALHHNILFLCAAIVGGFLIFMGLTTMLQKYLPNSLPAGKQIPPVTESANAVGGSAQPVLPVHNSEGNTGQARDVPSRGVSRESRREPAANSTAREGSVAAAPQIRNRQEMSRAGNTFGDSAKRLGMNGVRATARAGKKVGRAFKKIF